MSSYLMESPLEGARLLGQASFSPARERLLRAGLGAGMRALDVGCGSGATLPDLAALVGPEGTVTGVDASPQRLEEARRACAQLPRLELGQAALPATGLPGAQWDFVWSQYVFEYLPDPRLALDELVRLARPGGIVAVADVDRAGLDFWPVPEVVAQGRAVFLAALQARSVDLEVGRKLFHLFRRAGLEQVRVHASVMYLAAGAGEAALLEDWRLRFETLTPLMVPAFGGEAPWRAFAAAYLDMLRDPDTLKFGFVLTTAGTRP